MTRHDPGSESLAAHAPDGAPESVSAETEALLRRDLASGAATLESARPVLRHLLLGPDGALMGEDVVARVRGMALDVAAQLLSAVADRAEAPDRADFVAERQDGLAADLVADPALLAHCHILALEARIANRLQACNAIDPALSPLLQDEAASTDAARAGLAMEVLSAQTRFMQQQRRMELPPGELPGDLFHGALLALRAHVRDHEAAAEAAEQRLRDGFSEATSRLGLLARLVTALGVQGGDALTLERAGPAVFATALAMASGQDRGLAVLALNEGQVARLAVSLRAADLPGPAVEAQLAAAHGDPPLPRDAVALSPEAARALLADTARMDAG